MGTSNEGKALKIVGLGNPLLDISANVTAQVLDQYELKLDNAILAEEKHLKLYSDMMKMDGVELIAGGATQNSIRVAQWMLKKSNPAVTSFFGCVGNDEYGKMLEECATKDGVNVAYLKDTETPTGTCAVCVKEKERSLVANLAAANKFNVEHLNAEQSKDIINNGEIFYSAGFHLTVCPDAMELLGKHCAESNKVFSMNLSAPFLMQFFKEPLLKLIPYCDYVFSNETEAAEFGKMQGWGEDLDVVARKLAQLPKHSGARGRTVVFTQGSKETIVFHQGEILKFPVQPLADSEIVDTNGAGDAFVGGFLAQLSMGKALDQCVEAGCWAAQEIIKRSGCTFPEQCAFE